MTELPYLASASVTESADWDDFRVFLEVVRSGSFNRAAATLKMTQPTVSRRLIRLETVLHVRLFDRDRRGPRLTEAGQRIYNDACAAQVALARAATRAPGDGPAVEGDCKLLMSDGVAIYWMSRFVASFFSRHPNIELRIFGTNDARPEKRELFDLTIHYGEPTQTDPIAVRLGTLHVLPFASREYLRRHGTPDSAEGLSRHRLIEFAIYMSEMGSWTSWSAAEAAAHPMIYTNLTGCLAESVRHGAGIALLPSYATVVDENLVPLDVGIRYAVPIYVSHRRDALEKWPVRATFDFLRSCVFDKKTMPWFRETYHPPELAWSKRLPQERVPANAAA